jgi:hypothetical protein
MVGFFFGSVDGGGNMLIYLTLGTVLVTSEPDSQPGVSCRLYQTSKLRKNGFGKNERGEMKNQRVKVIVTIFSYLVQ